MDTEEKVSGESVEETKEAPAENREKKKRLRKGSMLRSALTLYLALAILAASATVGWFALNTKVYIENEVPGNLQVQVNTGALEISLDNVAYGARINTSTTDLFKNDLFGASDPEQSIYQGTEVDNDKTEKSYYIDISGNGEHLYFPNSLMDNDEPDLSDLSNFTDVTGDTRFYIDMKVYFRTTARMDVYLDAASEIIGMEGYTNSSDSNAYSRRSLYSSETTSIGCDGICAAARVAFLEPELDADGKETGELNLKCVWIPNDNVQLYYATEYIRDIETQVAKFDTSGNHRESLTGYSYLVKDEVNGCMVEVPYETEDYAYGRVMVDNNQLAKSSTNTINQAMPLVSFTEENELQTKSLVVRIWFEGTDREADKALNGGQVQYALAFSGIDKAECTGTEIFHGTDMCEAGTVPEGETGIYYNRNKSVRGLCYYSSVENLNTVTESPVASNVLSYSLDGIHWSAFTPTANALFTRGATAYTIYVRRAETAGTKPGDVIEIVIPEVDPPEPDAGS